MKNMKGQISLMAAVIGALGMITASAFASWATVNSRVGTAETRVSVVEERENNHFLQVQKQLDSIDAKLDKLLNGKK